MGPATSPGSSPSCALAAAAARLISARARMKARGRVRPLIGKFSTARCVCAPQSASAGTFSSPMLSRSTRYGGGLMRSGSCVHPMLYDVKSSTSNARRDCMQASSLTALSPVDGRYAGAVAPLRAPLPAPVRAQAQTLAREPGPAAPEAVKQIESRINHDVKAVEYFLRETLA